MILIITTPIFYSVIILDCIKCVSPCMVMEVIIHDFKLFMGSMVPAGVTYTAIEAPEGELGSS